LVAETTTSLVIVQSELLKAALLVSFIRSISTLTFTITLVVLVNTITVLTLPLALETAASLGWVLLVVFETAEGITVIGSISTLGCSVTELILSNALTVGTGPLGVWITSTDLGVIEIVSLVAAGCVSFIRFVFALSLTITESSLKDAVSVGTGPLALWIAATNLVVIERVSFEATGLVTFIGFVGALGFTITLTILGNAVTVGTGPLGFWVAATFLAVIEGELLEAALLVALIGSIEALRFTITELVVTDASTVGTGPLGVWIAAASLVVIELVLVEAAFLVTFVREIGTFWFSITELGLRDTISVLALELLRGASTSLIVVEAELLETANIISFVSLVSTLSFTITEAILGDTITVGTLVFTALTTALLVVVEWEISEAAHASRLFTIWMIQILDSKL
jgi:hypothetical protein